MIYIFTLSHDEWLNEPVQENNIRPLFIRIYACVNLFLNLPVGVYLYQMSSFFYD